eukprot:jgi/Pico_ML_1/56017/g1617.t1
MANTRLLPRVATTKLGGRTFRERIIPSAAALLASKSFAEAFLAASTRSASCASASHGAATAATLQEGAWSSLDASTTDHSVFSSDRHLPGVFNSAAIAAKRSKAMAKRMESDGMRRMDVLADLPSKKDLTT